MSRGREQTPEVGTPRAAVGRLSLYLRHLDSLSRAGNETVSSSKLGAALEITDAQVRKDLAYFGQFGYPGIGYRVEELRDSLRGVLGTDRIWKVALIGVGNIGRALLRYRGFPERGFPISMLFDRDPDLIGKKVSGLEVLALDLLPRKAREHRVEIAILAVPAVAADEVAALIVKAGISGILNFAPVPLKVPGDVSVVSVDLGVQFEQLAFQITSRQRSERPRTGT